VRRADNLTTFMCLLLGIAIPLTFYSILLLLLYVYHKFSHVMDGNFSFLCNYCVFLNTVMHRAS
jgi:hypothetical protein